VRIANWRHWARQLHELALVPEGQEERLMDASTTLLALAGLW